jgi:hypothetical protein
MSQINNIFKLEDILAEPLCPNRNNDFVPGAVLVEQMLSEAAAHAVKSQKSASVTIQLTFQPQGSSQVSILPKISSKLPDLKATSVLAYVDKSGRLVSEDTRQTTIVDVKSFHKG